MWNLLAMIAGVGVYFIVMSILSVAVIFLTDAPIIVEYFSFPTSPLLYLVSVQLCLSSYTALTAANAICNKSAKPNIAIYILTGLISFDCISATVQSYMEYGFDFDFCIPPLICVGLTVYIAYKIITRRNIAAEAARMGNNL